MPRQKDTGVAGRASRGDRAERAGLSARGSLVSARQRSSALVSAPRVLVVACRGSAALGRGGARRAVPRCLCPSSTGAASRHPRDRGVDESGDARGVPAPAAVRAARSPAAALEQEPRRQGLSFAENELGIRAASVCFAGTSPVIHFEDADGQHEITCGVGQWVRGHRAQPALGRDPTAAPGRQARRTLTGEDDAALRARHRARTSRRGSAVLRSRSAGAPPRGYWPGRPSTP